MMEAVTVPDHFPVNFRVSRQQRERMTQAAAERQESLSDFIRAAVADFLEEHERAGIGAGKT